MPLFLGFFGLRFQKFRSPIPRLIALLLLYHLLLWRTLIQFLPSIGWICPLHFQPFPFVGVNWIRNREAIILLHATVFRGSILNSGLPQSFCVILRAVIPFLLHLIILSSTSCAIDNFFAFSFCGDACLRFFCGSDLIQSTLLPSSVRAGSTILWYPSEYLLDELVRWFSFWIFFLSS